MLEKSCWEFFWPENANFAHVLAGRGKFDGLTDGPDRLSKSYN